MSAKLKNSKGEALDRPFATNILAKAKEIVANYEIVIAFEDGVWFGHGLELPGARGDGKTPQAAVADTREAMTGVVAYMLEQGQRPPEPAREGKRSVQINVRVTPEEKAVLESRSRAKGFRGLSDFIRTSVLTEK
jgi:predicted RNase H-like HicB family nuclease